MMGSVLMLIDVYILYTIFSFFTFFVALTDLIKLMRGTRIFLMIISTVLFFYLAFSSFSIESKFCTYASGFLCTTQSTQEIPLVILNIGFASFGILYIILEEMGMMPRETLENQEFS
jgi:hypothetical protein